MYKSDVEDSLESALRNTKIFELEEGRSKELSMTITKIEEAQLWFKSIKN